MSVMKKHYEKFIFIIVLFLFLILLGFEFLSASTPVENTFRRNNPQIDYPKSKDAVDFKDKKYDVKELYIQTHLDKEPAKAGDLKKNEKDKKNLKDKKVVLTEKKNLGIDLLAPPVLAKCPKGEHLIPITDFPLNEEQLKKKKCSFCLSPLEFIPPDQIPKEDPEISTKDTDGDGIPDADEIKLGLNPEFKGDAERDIDGDGFTNLEEYRSKTDIRDPKSRDSYAKKIFVKDIKETTIGIKVLRFINDERYKDDPTKWTVVFYSEQMVKRGKSERTLRKTPRARIGREIKKVGVDGGDYLVEKINVKFDDKQGNTQNVSTVFIKRESDKIVFAARPGELFIDPRKEITFEVVNLPAGITVTVNNQPVKNQKEFSIMIGQEFSIGNEKTGFDKFVTLSADKRPYEANAENKMTSKIKNVDRGNILDIKTRRTDIQMNEEIPGVRPEQTIDSF